MPDFKMPLSGDVNQSFGWWTGLLNAIGNQFSLLSINLGRSSNPKAEEEILTEVASYGKQLGRVEDALAVLIRKLNLNLSGEDAKAIRDLERMLEDIAEVKARHAAPRHSSAQDQ